MQKHKYNRVLLPHIGMRIPVRVALTLIIVMIDYDDPSTIEPMSSRANMWIRKTEDSSFDKYTVCFDFHLTCWNTISLSRLGFTHHPQPPPSLLSSSWFVSSAFNDGCEFFLLWKTPPSCRNWLPGLLWWKSRDFLGVGMIYLHRLYCELFLSFIIQKPDLCTSIADQFMLKLIRFERTTLMHKK